MTLLAMSPRIDRLLNDRDRCRSELRVIERIADYFPERDELVTARHCAEAELRLINAELDDEGIFA